MVQIFLSLLSDKFCEWSLKMNVIQGHWTATTNKASL